MSMEEGITFTKEKAEAFRDAYVDALRYKALGNSMAVPVMKHIGKQIQKVFGDEEK